MRTRMVATLTDLMQRPDHTCVLAVSHGSAIKEFLDHVRGAAADERERVPGNCSVLHFALTMRPIRLNWSKSLRRKTTRASWG